MEPVSVGMLVNVAAGGPLLEEIRRARRNAAVG
jgi:hypothetical protein